MKPSKTKRKPPASRKGLDKVRSVRIRQDQQERIKEISEQTGASAAEVLRRLLDAGLSA
jgi:predicted DNA-binding protein